MNHPFSASRAELITELGVLIQVVVAQDTTGHTDIGLDAAERYSVEAAMAARLGELLRKLFPAPPAMPSVHEAPPSGEESFVDIKTGESDERRRLARTLLDIHEGGAAPGHEGPQQAALIRNALELARAVIRVNPDRELKIRELARDLLDALHAPAHTYDSASRVEWQERIRARARDMAEFVLEEKNG